MHIPDGWLSLGVSLATWAITLVALTIAMSKINREDLDKLSNIGAIAAVIFVAQMFNFPVAGGTSGHLLGSALAVYVVGVPGAIIALFVVLLVQAVVFADGGILALGANTFNLGVVGVLVAYGVIKIVETYSGKEDTDGKLFLGGAFVAAFLSVVVSAGLAGIELVLSNTTTLAVSLPPILFWHTLIGLGEAIITLFVLTYLMEVDFPLAQFDEEDTSFIDAVKDSNKPVLGVSILIMAISLLSLLASSNPDGLEFVGISNNYGKGHSFSAGIADDYAFLGMQTIIGTFLSALLGVVILSGVFIIPSAYIRERKSSTTI